jgi:hypothetical protein
MEMMLCSVTASSPNVRPGSTTSPTIPLTQITTEVKTHPGVTGNATVMITNNGTKAFQNCFGLESLSPSSSLSSSAFLSFLAAAGSASSVGNASGSSMIVGNSAKLHRHDVHLGCNIGFHVESNAEIWRERKSRQRKTPTTKMVAKC